MAEVVDAAVITDELAPLTGLDQMVAAITEQAIALAEQYRPHAIVDEQDYRDSKKARAQARKDIKALRADYAERMGIIRDAVKDADARVKVALAPLDAIDSSYKREITAHETAWMEARIAELQAEYESYAPALVPLVPMARLIEVYGQQDGQKWLNRGTNIQLAKTLLRVAVDNIADGEQRVTDSVEPDDLEGAKADYFTSLDADSAIESARKRAERRADVRRLEQERREAEEEEARRVAEMQRAAAEERKLAAIDSRSVMSREEYEQELAEVMAPVPEKPTSRRQLLMDMTGRKRVIFAFTEPVEQLTLDVTQQEFDLLIRIFKNNDVHGRIRRIQ